MKPFTQCCMSIVLTALPLTAFPEEQGVPDAEAHSSFSFVHYYSARAYNFQYIDEFFQKKIKETEKLDFDLHLRWMENRMEFAKFLLHSLVCEAHWNSSDAERLRLFREFSAWRKYAAKERPANAHYIAPWNSLKGMMIDTQRLCTRYDALSLLLKSPESYTVYSELANKGELRLDGAPSHPVRMHYGELTTEVKTWNDELNYDFHAELLPETCLKIKSGFIGCLRTFESPSPSTMAQYYLGVWDDAGKNLALHLLDIPAEKRNRLAVESNLYGHLIAIHAADGVYGEKLKLSVSGQYAEVALLVSGSGKPVWTGKYPLDSRNRNSIRRE